MSIKRALSCLCACIMVGLSGCALAAEAVKADIPASAPIVWQSNTGKMQIYVQDISMTRPEGTELYQIDVTPRLFNDGEILRVLQCFTPEATQLDAEYTEPFPNSIRLAIKNEQIELMASGRRDNGTLSEVRLKCVWRNDEYITGDMQILQRWHDGPAKHCRYTLEEARAIADAAAAAIAPDYAYSTWGLAEQYPRDGSDTGNDDYDYLGGYRLCYTPVIEGLQMPYTPNEDEVDGLTLQPVRLPRLYITVMDRGLYEVCWEGAQDIGNKTPITELLSDAQIIEIAQSILPLAHMELEKTHGDAAAMVVERIALSYCRVQRRDMPGQYVLTPVWDFFGYEAMENQDGTLMLHNINPNVSLLTISAIDGTVIDRQYGY